MSVRHLDRLFEPHSVAVVGASDRPGSLGSLVMRNLRDSGFAGPVWPVNTRQAQVAGTPAFATLEALPQPPDLAVICTPAATVPGLIEQLGRKGGRAAVVLSAGLRQAEAPGQPTLEQAMLDAARPYLLRVLGPNCVGLLVPRVGLNASFAHTGARDGALAFVSQSGALTTALLDWAGGRGIGFSHFISLGDSADVDFGDVLDYLASDGSTRAILLYVESIRAARKFMSAARAAARNKPVLIVKAGRAPAGAQAASSHTGAMAGADPVFDAAIRRAGMLRVDTLGALFDAAQTLARVSVPGSDRLLIVTNGGGAGVLAADAVSLAGGQLATLTPETKKALDACLPQGWSHGNPVDIVGDAPVSRYLAAFDALSTQPSADAWLFMHAPTAVVPSQDIAQACIPVLKALKRPVLTSWLGGPAVREAQQACEAAGLATYETPERAVAAFMQMVTYRRNQEALRQVPALDDADLSRTVDLPAARAVLTQALAQGRDVLTELEAKAVLSAAGIPTVPTVQAADEEAAVAAAGEMGYPVVLKILSHDITHKSDVGGVALSLADEDALRRAWRSMHARIREHMPQARLDGCTVQPMVRRPKAHELIAGLAEDPVFGPVVLFGQGGTAVELLADRAVALPPLNALLADDLISRTRIARLLAGWRERPAVDHEGLRSVLLRLSHLACELPELAELDINPLLADEQGVLALDARIVVRASTLSAPADRLAILPYPAHLQTSLKLSGQALTLRPIRPDDFHLLQDFYAHADPVDLRLRFFMTRREVPVTELARYSQIDYDRDMTFIACLGEVSSQAPSRMIGEVRTVSDPDRERAEFSIQVRRDWQGKGLGLILMQRLIDYLRARGTQTLVGECLDDNLAMQALAQRCGFTVTRSRDGSPWQLSLDLMAN